MKTNKRINTVSIITSVLLTTFLLCTCVSFDTAPAGSARSSGVVLGPDELDDTLREASDEINSKVSAGSFIGIINIQSASVALSEYVIDELIGNAVRDGNFTVLDRQRLDQVRQEQNFQLSGEVDDDFALAIGRLIGIQTIVTGTVSPLGSRYRITVRALDVQTGAVQVQFNKNIAAGETIVALMQSGGTSTATASGGRSGGTTTASGGQTQAAAPVQIANGTYTYYPRLRAFRGGVNIDDYIVKIVVRNNYFIVYMTNVSIGRGNPYANSNGWNYSNNVILQDLDRPSRAYSMINHALDDEGNQLLTFQNVTGTRFSLINNYRDPNVIFEEITLGEPDE